jgi:hypothetical protein
MMFRCDLSDPQARRNCGRAPRDLPYFRVEDFARRFDWFKRNCGCDAQGLRQCLRHRAGARRGVAEVRCGNWRTIIRRLIVACRLHSEGYRNLWARLHFAGVRASTRRLRADQCRLDQNPMTNLKLAA